MLNEVEQATIRINEIINDEAIMVQEQGENLDIITEELTKTNQNVEESNRNLDEAVALQKKTNPKYRLLIFIVALVLVVVGGVISIVTQWMNLR